MRKTSYCFIYWTVVISICLNALSCSSGGGGLNAMSTTTSNSGNNGDNNGNDGNTGVITGTELTSCGALTQASTTYVLQNDVSSNGSCFMVTAYVLDQMTT